MGIVVVPEVTDVNSPVVVALYSIESFKLIVSVRPSNLTAADAGVAGRGGSVTMQGSDAGSPVSALYRILSVTSFSVCTRLVMLSVFAVIAVQDVPFVLNSMKSVTPATISARVSSVMPVGNVVAAFGTTTVLMPDDGAVSVALVLSKTVVEASPNTVRGIVVAPIDSQASPLFKLYSIAVETPVMLSVEPLYAAPGAAPRAGTVTVRGCAGTNVASVALTRTW